MNYFPENYALGACEYSENDFWYFVHGAPMTADVGWKIYVSFTQQFADTVLRNVFPYLLEAHVNFKYIKSSELLHKLNSGLAGYSQIGKCLVIYACDRSVGILNALSRQLSGATIAAPRPPFAKRFSSDLPIFYRYGTYNIKSKKVGVWEERMQPEHREIAPAPSGVIPQVALSNLDRLLLQYPVIDVVAQRGKGGVFLALDLRQQQYAEVILKIGYLHGEERTPGVDGVSLVCNEESILRFLDEHSLPVETPRFIASAFGDESFGVIQTKLQGKNARQCLIEGKLGVLQVTKILEGIRALHSLGILWCDAKIDNVIFDEDSGSIGFVDFETACLENSSGINCTRTFPLSHSQTSQTSLFDLELIHFLCSLLFDVESDDQGEVNPWDLGSRRYDSELKRHVADELLSRITI